MGHDAIIQDIDSEKSWVTPYSTMHGSTLPEAVTSVVPFSAASSGSFAAPVGRTYTVTDPGRALISGKCQDIGKVKGPILRGLAGRAPYFHNGSAATLLDVVNFYNQRFNIGLTPAQMSDMAAFLQTL